MKLTLNGSTIAATAVAASVLVILLNAVLVMLCWNMFLIPAVTGVNEIDFWQAIGLSILAGILFKDSGISFKV